MNTATQKYCRTRLAPTPSGYLHLGNILSFVITIELARKTGARILLRIDDLDEERVRSAYVQDIFDTLHFLELPWDEGPKDVADFQESYSQKHRMPLYHQAMADLRQKPEVFACTCSRADILRQSTDGCYPGTCRHKGLPLDTPGAAWRVRTPETVALRVITPGGVQQVNTLPPAVRDFVVRKKDGVAAYQLASITDDVHFGVDLVVRGEDLWASTLAQVYLSSLLPAPAFAQTTFLHHPLIRDAKGEKLSKSAGATSVYGLRKAGWSRRRVYGHLASLCGVQEPVADWQALAASLATVQTRQSFGPIVLPL